MCGIFAYLNYGVPRSRRAIVNSLLNGLKRLEYRGYDSAGMAIDADAKLGEAPAITLIKQSGKVSALEQKIETQGLDLDREFDVHIGIAHTRWATHGPPNEVNCHPHRSDEKNTFVVIHNGIITNCKELKTLLMGKGYAFESETDTETIAKLIKYIYDTNKDKGDEMDFLQLVEATISQLEGAFALIFKSSVFPGEVVATRRGSPLLIGVRSDSHSMDNIPIFVTDKTAGKSSKAALDVVDSGETSLRRVNSWDRYLNSDVKSEFFLASDASAIIEHTKRVIFLEDDDVALIKCGQLTIHRLKHGANISRPVKTLEIELQELMKGSFSHFMLKEIYEQPESVFNTMRGRVDFDTGHVMLGGLRDFIPDMKRCRRLMFIACGTSYNSAIACRQFLEETTELPVIVDIASDFLDRSCPIFRDDVCFFISQSGETADTLSALRYCKKKGALVVGITNTVGSTISRETHCGVHINAGPEIGVASTKAYTSQIISLVLFGLMMAADRKSMQTRNREVIESLRQLPDAIRKVLELDGRMKELAQELYEQRSLLVMGRGPNYANCLEGALKIKELTYMHSEGILAGELKHGPLALVDHTMPIIMIVMRDNTHGKSQNALEQIVARHGRPIVICAEGDKLTAGGVEIRTVEVPQLVDCIQSVITVVPLQLLAYHIACLRGLDVDCPRNLAKSVTVE